MSQADRLLELLLDGQPHSTVEIQKVVYGGEHLGTARIASRVTDLRDRGYVIEARQGLKNKTVWYYKLMSEPEKVAEPKPIFILDRRSGKRMTREEYDMVYG